MRPGWAITRRARTSSARRATSSPRRNSRRCSGARWRGKWRRSWHDSAPHILELGAGSGKLAADMLAELEQLGSLPDSYAILEVSADLRARQQALMRERLPHLLDRVHWLDALPEKFSGAIVANEVLDALPVHLVHWRDSAITERGVAAGRARFHLAGARHQRCGSAACRAARSRCRMIMSAKSVLPRAA